MSVNSYRYYNSITHPSLITVVDYAVGRQEVRRRCGKISDHALTTQLPTFFKSFSTKAATGGVLLKKLFSKISQYSPTGLQLYKKRLQDRGFPVNIAKFSNTAILKNIRERLILFQTETLQMFSKVSN